MMIKLILILLCIMAHKVFIQKWLPYRWLINSLVYPVAYWRMKHTIKKLNGLNQRAKLINLWYVFKSKWFAKYWFGKRLIIILENEIIKEDAVNLESI